MRFLVLGPLEVSEEGGDQLAIAGAKERTILAHLIARAGQVVSVDDLIEELWGGEPPRAPEKTLASYVSRLRRDLRVRPSADANGDVIVFRSDGYALQADGNEIDAATFERLASDGHRLLGSGHVDEADPVLGRALGMWRGDAYQGFRYTRFGASEGDRLDELRRTAAEDLVDARLGGADPAALVPDLESMVRDEPLRERRWGQLMVALYRSGRQAEALQAFRRAREVLVDELGIEPGPELQRLQTAILSHDLPLEGGTRARSTPDRRVDVCPYKGLARFEPADADFYFGREQMVAEAVGHVVAGRFLALVGPSGSGKSSLLRAGVVHALRSGAVPGSDRWACTVIRPGDRSLDTITRALREPSDGQRRVIAIDQFEEIFTGGADDDARTSVLDAITHAASAREGDTTIVVAMRADFYGRCAEHRGFASLLASGQILVGPMDSEEVRRAIELPAERTALRLDAGLADALVSDTVGQPGALPLLSTALLELWVHRRDGLLSLDDYRRGGGVEGAVARLGEEAYARLDAAEQAAAKRILLRLAAQGEGAEVVRRRAPLGEFDLDRDADAAHAMDVLADARLVTVSEGYAEVAHEALLREWPRLRAWLDDDAEGRRLHRHVTDASQTWDEGGRDPADLYRGARLTATWDWAEPHVADLNDLERAFLGASRAASEGEAARTRRTNRRLRGLLAGVAALLVVALVIGDVALTQRDRARQALTVADAQRLAARSRLEADPQLALLMARESVNIDDSAETRSALFSALERAPEITARIASPTGPSTGGDETQWIAMAPGTQTIAIGDASNTVELFDAVNRASIGTVDIGAGTQGGAFSPDGKTLTVVTSHGDLVNIDVATRAVVAHVAAGFVDAVAYAPDGTRLVTAEPRPHGKELLVPRDPRTLRPSGAPAQTGAGQPQVSPLSSFAMAFSPDGSLITTRPSGPGRPTIEWSADLKPMRRFAIAGTGVAMSPNGRTAAIIGNSGEGSADTQTQVAFLDIDTGASRVTSINHGASASTQFEILGAGFSPDGRTLVTTGNDQQLSIWNVATASVSRSLGGAGVPLRGPVLSADGSAAFTTDRNREVVVWDLSGDGSLVRPFAAGSGIGQWPYFAESPNGRLLAVPSASKSSSSIALIDTRSLKIVRRIDSSRSLPLGLAFSPDSSTLAVGSSGVDHYFARLWDVATGKPASGNLPGIERTQVWTFAFSPSGDSLAGGGPVRPSGASGRTYLWDLTNGPRLVGHVDTQQPVDQVAFTPDGSVLTAATGQAAGGVLVTWDGHTLAPLLNVRVDNVGLYSSDVSNDGRAIVTGGQAGPRLWDIATGTPLGPPMTGLNGLAGTVDISADGSTVVGADESGTVLLWDVSTGTPLGDPLPGPTPDRWMAALFSPSGARLFVVSDDGRAWSWDVDRSDWLVQACTIAGRNMTQQEWQQVLPGQPYEATCAS